MLRSFFPIFQTLERDVHAFVTIDNEVGKVIYRTEAKREPLQVMLSGKKY